MTADRAETRIEEGLTAAEEARSKQITNDPAVQKEIARFRRKARKGKVRPGMSADDLLNLAREQRQRS
jgi:hypothetical protein